MRYIFPTITLCLLLVSCVQHDDSWADQIIKSEKDVTMVASLDLKKLLQKADLPNNSQLGADQKIMINAFESSMKPIVVILKGVSRGSLRLDLIGFGGLRFYSASVGRLRT